MTGIWVCFLFDPTQLQPQNRHRLFGWMSTAHWNGTVFRSGESTEQNIEADADSDEGAELMSQLSLEIEDLKNQFNDEIRANLETEFLETVVRVEEICKPRMIERELAIFERKILSLKRRSERAKQANDEVSKSPLM